jgi:phage host-nuclease inhibitor protein Gam
MPLQSDDELVVRAREVALQIRAISDFDIERSRILTNAANVIADLTYRLASETRPDCDEYPLPPPIGLNVSRGMGLGYVRH